MSLVFVVTEGSYSSKEIVGIFDSKEKAEDYIKMAAMAGDDYNDNIEEYELNKCHLESNTMKNLAEYKQGFRTYVLNTDLKSGNIYNISEKDCVLYNFQYDSVDRMQRAARLINNNTYSMNYGATIKAKSSDQAIKIYSDLRRQALALLRVSFGDFFEGMEKAI